MKRILLYILAFGFVCCGPGELSRQVNPFIGTDGPGNVYPGAQLPFGMVQLSPDNGISGWDRIAGYFYPDSTIAGFSHTHLSGTGAGDLYDISFMPAVKPYKVGRGELGLYSTFDHSQESAHAGYYQVLLKDYGINVELTATARGGVQRYTFVQNDSALVVLNLQKAMNWDFTKQCGVEVIDSVTIRGYRFSEGWAPDQRVYFVSKFSKPFIHSDIDGGIAKFYFSTSQGEKIEVSTALSGVSAEGAAANYNAELQGVSFDKALKNAQGEWDAELSKIEVGGGTADERVVFYTALYRTMLAPTIYNDVTGDYFGSDKQPHKADFTNYHTFSLWDTYRAEHPLLTMLHPERVSDMVSSFLAFYDQTSKLPVWNMWGNETNMMIGYHSIPVIVEAYLKGVPMDSERALNACIVTMNGVPYPEYFPADKINESVSKTIEYAYDNWCIYLMASKMGKHQIAADFLNRSKDYRHIFKDGFFQPRNSDGSFVGDFDPAPYTAHITESNGWQYRFAVQQDVQAMIELMGGANAFEQALDSMFTLAPSSGDSLPIFSTGMIGQYAHGNEPSHHVAYLYNAIGRYDKTALYVNKIMREQYANTPAGVCGNEDCGQMSAWLVLSAMGFYPVDPAALRYELGVPLFSEITLMGNFKIIAKGLSSERCEVEKVLLNGRELTERFITWADITRGGTLEFVIKK